MIIERGLLLAFAIVGFLIFLNGLTGYRTCVEVGLAQGQAPQMFCKTQSGLARWLSEILPERS